jgi:hypothetical protein
MKGFFIDEAAPRRINQENSSFGDEIKFIDSQNLLFAAIMQGDDIRIFQQFL